MNRVRSDSFQLDSLRPNGESDFVGNTALAFGEGGVFNPVSHPVPCSIEPIPSQGTTNADTKECRGTHAESQSNPGSTQPISQLV